MYAYGTVIYICDTQVDTVTRLLQSDMIRVYHRLCANMLSLHIGNTNDMMICPTGRNDQQTTNKLDIKVDDQQITQVPECKYIGVSMIDQYFKFDIYI
jgi:hypothetical protein